MVEPLTKDEEPREINLFDLIIVLLKYKWSILSFVAVTMIVALIYSNISRARDESKNAISPSMPLFYYSECLVEPDRGTAEAIGFLIRRQSFLLKMVEENRLENEIRQSILNEKRQDETTRKQPTGQELFSWMRQNLFLSQSGAFLTIGFVSSQKELPPRIISALLLNISEYFRKRDIEILSAQQNLLLRRLETAQDSILKSRIADEMITVIGKEAGVRSKKYYGFILLDPPSPSAKVRIITTGRERKVEALESIATPLVPAKPKHGIILIMVFLVALVIAISLAFFIEYIRNIKRIDAEKIAAIRRYLSIRGK